LLSYDQNTTSHNVLYALSLHDALPIYDSRRGRLELDATGGRRHRRRCGRVLPRTRANREGGGRRAAFHAARAVGAEVVRERRGRSEEHTSELQSLAYLVCRLLLENKKT